MRGEMIRGQLLKTPNTHYRNKKPPALSGYKDYVCRRPSTLGNPFKIRDGHPRHAVIRAHREWLQSQDESDPVLQKQLERLRDIYKEVKGGWNIRFLCTCAELELCHTDTFIQLIEQKLDEESV